MLKKAGIVYVYGTILLPRPLDSGGSPIGEPIEHSVPYEYGRWVAVKGSRYADGRKAKKGVWGI